MPLAEQSPALCTWKEDQAKTTGVIPVVGGWDVGGLWPYALTPFFHFSLGVTEFASHHNRPWACILFWTQDLSLAPIPSFVPFSIIKREDFTEPKGEKNQKSTQAT